MSEYGRGTSQPASTLTHTPSQTLAAVGDSFTESLVIRERHTRSTATQGRWKQDEGHTGRGKIAPH